MVGWYFWFSLASRPGSRACITTERYNLGQHPWVAPIDKLSVAFAIVLAVTFLGEGMSLKVGGRRATHRCGQPGIGVRLILAHRKN